MGNPNHRGKTHVLVTGAAGFIGRNLVERFVSRDDYYVTAVSYTRPPYEFGSNQNLEWVQADLRDEKSVRDLAKGKDVWIQAAATTSGAKQIVNSPSIHVTDNAVMNSYIFRAAQESRVSQVIFFSCTIMYPSVDRAVSECDFDGSQEMFPKYFGAGWTKFYLEKMAEFYSRLGETSFTVLRHSNVYGPWDKFDPGKSHVFAATLSKILNARDGRLEIWGNGEEKRDFIFVSDLLNAIEASLEAEKRDQKRFRLYNIGSGNGISINNLAAKMMELLGKELVIEHNVDKPTLPVSFWLDCSRAENEIGWKPRVNLDDGILETVKWLKGQ